MYTPNTYPWGPNFSPFCSTTRRFRDTRPVVKTETHRVTPNWTWTLGSQKYPVYIKILTPEAQILVCFALRPAVSKISHILSFPIDYHVKRQKKKKKNKIICQKSKIFKFHYSFNNFVRDPPQEYTWILGSKSGLLFQRCRLKLLPPYGPMLTKTIKKMAKIQYLKFPYSLTNFGRDPS